MDVICDIEIINLKKKRNFFFKEGYEFIKHNIYENLS